MTMYVWMDGCMDGWMDGCVCVRMYVCMHLGMYVCMCCDFALFCALACTRCGMNGQAVRVEGAQDLDRKKHMLCC